MTSTNYMQKIQLYLTGVVFPAEKEELIAAVENAVADDIEANEGILARFRSLPDRQYISRDDVVREMRNRDEDYEE